MNGVNTLLSILFYVGAAVVGAAAIFALFRSRYIKATVEELRGDRDDQIKRIERLEHERDEAKTDNIRLNLLSEQQAAQIETLKEALSGKAQLDHLQAQIDAHDKRVDERHATLIHEMSKVVTSNVELAETNQAVVDSNQYTQAALLDLLKKQERES